RDWDFATEFGLPIVEVVRRAGAERQGDESAGGDVSESAYSGDVHPVQEARVDQCAVAAAKQAMTERLTAEGRGRARIEYKLRDWLFARQRYWGEPFP
ncbi:leucine--tRNA ligase, partial [Mycobacterium sp. ITM-2017-0098]